MLFWLQLMQAKRRPPRQLSSSLSPPSCQNLPPPYIWQCSFTCNHPLGQLCSYKPGWKIPRLEMLQLTEVIGPGVGQGRLRDGGPGKVRRQQGARWWVPLQEDLKGEGSQKFLAAPANRASLRPLQKGIALLFPTQCPKIHSQKASCTKTKPLVISGQFWTPGILHTFH